MHPLFHAALVSRGLLSRLLGPRDGKRAIQGINGTQRLLRDLPPFLVIAYEGDGGVAGYELHPPLLGLGSRDGGRELVKK